LTSRFIVTATPELYKSALRELLAVANDLEERRAFRDGVFLVETDVPAPEFTRALAQADPVFVKHLFPAQTEFPLTGAKEADLPAILQNLEAICSVAPGEPFAVQCRRVGPDHDYTAKDVEVFAGSSLEAQGGVPTFSDVEVAAHDDLKVLSLYLFRDTGYGGCSTVGENLNEHCDEYRVFSRARGREISRAEFKLKEAIRKFRLDLAGGRAIDLGAAPGGWTKVLADAGMSVVAVDPADLDERVARLPSVTHVRSKAEDLDCKGEFDLLVNDMNVDPEESARETVRLAPRLKPGGLALMTAKLVTRNPERLLREAASTLEPAYEIVRVKNLFHNRREVTILLKKINAEATL
jgi:23S rRNA (cytidine2498-2'-O)-methyltransferase